MGSATIRWKVVYVLFLHVGAYSKKIKYYILVLIGLKEAAIVPFMFQTDQ